MKNLKEKFQKRITFVKPLYKKVNSNPKTSSKREFVSLNVDDKLYGNGFDVENNVRAKRTDAVTVFHNNCTEKYNIVLPGSCLKNTKTCFKVQKGHPKARLLKMAENSESRRHLPVIQIPDTWLRVHPAPVLPKESKCSVLFRCCFCQMGLCTFLCVWILTWTLVIQSFEGPNEIHTYQVFIDQQNRLAIDLATELRQISPLSSKWFQTIEDHLGHERVLTINGAGKGTRALQGSFWDISGTFLFSIYVMTAVGFGAPVPQTLWGRTTTVIYGIVAIPAHIYLMIHFSTCAVVNAEHLQRRLKSFLDERKPLDVARNGLDGKIDSSNSSRNSVKANKCILRKSLIRILGILFIARGVPLAILSYYILGLVVFGLPHNGGYKETIDVILFPLEFTTTGGLETVKSCLRILYALYLEGAMVLLSCALATLKRHCSRSVISMADRYRLFVSEDLYK